MMSKKLFIPVTDELLFDHPELISTPLRPYTQDLACYHWLDVRINPDDDVNIAKPYKRSAHQKSHLENEFPQAAAA